MKNQKINFTCLKNVYRAQNSFKVVKMRLMIEWGAEGPF